MKIDLNDPRITAFALGELKGQDARDMARAVRSDPRVRAAVDEVRATSGLLMETLGGGEAHLLTPGQREAVRSAGASAVITEMASARVPFWRRPAVAGIGVAAAVAIVIYGIGGRPGGGGGGGETDPQAWNWAQVDMENLTLPADIGTGGAEAGMVAAAGDDARAPLTLVDAIADDTTGFRRELVQRIEKITPAELSAGRGLPELDEAAESPWRRVAADGRLPVPLSSGATSWPWIERCVMEHKKRPPQRVVRIEEMVNHFRYKKPSMLVAGGFAADMEACQTPWNPQTALLAVHIMKDSSAGEMTQEVGLSFNPERVARVRLLGYAGLKSAGLRGFSGLKTASGSHGNYVIYEVELKRSTAEGQGRAIATLLLGEQGEASGATLHLGEAGEAGEEGADARLPIGRINSWINASPDMRYATALTACGLMLKGSQDVGELNVDSLRSLLEIIEKQDSALLGGGRRDGLKVIRQAAQLIAGQGNERANEGD